MNNDSSFSDQFCESVVHTCRRETTIVCIVNSCNHLLLLNMAGVDCGGVSSILSVSENIVCCEVLQWL